MIKLACAAARRRRGGEGGFVMLEMLVSLTVISIVMTAFSTYFISSQVSEASQNTIQPAVQLVSSGFDTVNAVPAGQALWGRSATAATTQWGGFSSNTVVSPYLAGASSAGYDATSTAPLSVPWNDSTTINGVVYTRYWLLGKPTTTNTTALLVVVAVTWSDPRSTCQKDANGKCWFVRSSMQSSNATYTPTPSPTPVGQTPSPIPEGTPTGTPAPTTVPVATPAVSPPPTPIPMPTSRVTLTRQWTAGTGVGASDGNVYVWGQTSNYLDGTDNGQDDTPPTKVTALTTAVRSVTCPTTGAASPTVIRQTSGGQNWLDALDSCGYVWGVGNNDLYSLGNSGSLTKAPYVTRVLKANTGTPLNNIVYITSSDLAGAAVDSSGNVWVWGDAVHGGGGDHNNAVMVTGQSGSTYATGGPAVYVQGGHQNIWIILQDGTVWTIGGTIGIPGTFPGNATAVAYKVTGLASWFGKIQKVVSGLHDGYGAALLKDGTLLTWQSQQAATAFATASTSPFVDIHSSDFGFIALTANGQAWVSSDSPNEDGGPAQVNNKDTMVKEDINVVGVYAGYNFYYWERSDGTFWGIGQTNDGGIGSPANVNVISVPRKITWPSGNTYTNLSMLS